MNLWSPLDVASLGRPLPTLPFTKVGCSGDRPLQTAATEEPDDHTVDQHGHIDGLWEANNDANGRHRFRYSVVSAYNDLPATVRSLGRVQFKSEVRKHLLTEQHSEPG